MYLNQVAIKIIYADVGTDLVQLLAKYVPNEIANMERVYGHPNIVSDFNTYFGRELESFSYSFANFYIILQLALVDKHLLFGTPGL